MGLTDIRSLTPCDRAAVFGLVCRELLDEADPDHPSDATAAADFTALNAALDRHLAEDAGIAFAVAIQDGVVVGAVGVAASFMASPGVWEIGWQVVQEQSRRQGIGSALLRHAEELARARGAEILLLSSGDPDYHQGAGYGVVVRSAGEVVMARTLAANGT